MQENYTKAELYAGRNGVSEVLTVTVTTNTDQADTETGAIPLYTVIGARESDLELMALVATSDSNSISDELIGYVPVSYFIHNGTDRYYSGADAIFRKDIPGTSIQFIDGVHEFTTGDTVDAYVLPVGNGQIHPNLTQDAAILLATNMMQTLRDEVDNVADDEFKARMLELGFRYDA